ncbi:branched-chain amino acid aminotransferase [Eubacterium sp. AB3007]|uniref:branched-chain amino acid aminotransferase n=1 Tax=Eubacterium sp. AB3007 TaxID=1392487 RepID=UPI000484FAAF|nr:branched-chain amino acid aminotransferase [Eubacterium sp. AB3007]
MAKDIDWGSLGFGYTPTDYRYVATYKDGKWSEGQLITDPVVHITECAGVLQYAQTVFEGLKAYTTEDGRIVTFRPELNAQRLIDSARRLVIPEVPVEMFMDAVDKVVAANKEYVPPFGSGATLYLRPFIYGSGPQIGVAPAPEYEFRLIAMPVGPYFKEGAKPINIRISERDRTAPRGTGDIKAGLNYAMSIREGQDAHAAGYADNLYLDPATRTNVEEASGANIIFITKDGKFVTPKSDTILPSVTRRSLMVVAEKYLGMEVEHRTVPFEEVSEFAECGLCGTAAVISPVGKITYDGGVIEFPTGMEEMGPTIRKLYETLTGIQMGTVEAPEGWIHEIK